MCENGIISPFGVFPQFYSVRTSSTTTRDRNLQFRGVVSTGGSPLDFFLFLQIYVQFSKTSPLNLEKVAKNPVEKIASNPVTSVAVMAFSALIVFSASKLGIFPLKRSVLGVWGRL